MAHRVICNEAQNHLQWIVVRDDLIMVAGPFADEAIAALHCDALNREPPAPIKSRLVDFVSRLVRAGWSGRFDLSTLGRSS